MTADKARELRNKSLNVVEQINCLIEKAASRGESMIEVGVIEKKLHDIAMYYMIGGFSVKKNEVEFTLKISW